MLRLASAFLLSGLLLWAAPDDYPLGPDSQRQAGVPQGAVTKYSLTSKIYPGTTRDYWVYVPAQYKGDRPACVMIFQDGGGFVGEQSSWHAPVVLDNLIAKGQMPVTVGVFINPGVLPALTPDQQARYNRSFEYDALGDRYARFLVEEVLPEVGQKVKLSPDPNDRGLAGSSSGGIAAFTAAWNRPDQFRRVLSFIGSYTNLRGGDTYPGLIRKMEPKPLRVFLQDGRNDQNIYGGNWFLGNQEMASALTYAGYDTMFVVGSEGHNGKHGSAILPDALRWLWRDYPQPVAAPQPKGERHFISLILDPASDWELVSQGHQFTEGPAVDKKGIVYFTDAPANKLFKVGADGKATVFKEDAGGISGLMFGPDGRLYACQNGRQRVVAYDADGKETVLAEKAPSNDLALNAKGDLYYTDPAHKAVWLLTAKGERRIVYQGMAFPNGVRFSPDQSLLMVADTQGKHVWSFQVQPDGGLTSGQPFYRMEMPEDVTNGPLRSGADGMTLDTEGYLYVATKLGIQICDQPGRVVGIIRKPGTADPSNVVLGGPDFQTLYVTAGDKVYRRHLRRKGLAPGQIVKPPKPQL